MPKFQVTHNHHFVWRAYLKPWCENKCKNSGEEKYYIWWNNRKVVRQTDVFDILRKKDFYEYKTLNKLELYLLNNMYKKSGWKGLEKTTVYFDSITELANLLANDKFNGEYRELLIELGETVQSMGEKIGQKYIDKLYIDDLSFFDVNEEDGMDFLFYLFMQYFRTKAMRERASLSLTIMNDDIIKKICESELHEDIVYSIDWNNIYNYGYIYLVNSVTYGYIHYGCHIRLLKSKGARFIVSDQPVYNCSENKSKDYDLFYPIDPNRAILLSKYFEKNEVLEISDDEVLRYNLLTVNNAYEFILGKEKVDIDFKY